MPGYPTNLERCGYGTDSGCGEFVNEQAHIVLYGRGRMGNESRNNDEGHILYHPECCPHHEGKQ